MTKNPPQSFLIMNPYGIGDVLFATPIIQSLRDHNPDAKIYFLCNKRTEPVLKLFPEITKLFVYERDDFVRLKKESFFAWFGAFKGLIGAIRAEKIDVAFDLSLNVQFGLFAMLGGIKRRIGLNYKKRGRLLTDKIPITGFNDKHVVDYYSDVLKPLGIEVSARHLTMHTDPTSDEWVTDFLKDKYDLGSGPLIGIAPCGGEAFGDNAFMKRWPQEQFSELMNRLTQELNGTLVLFASKSEEPYLNEIFESVRDKGRCIYFTDYSFIHVISMVKRCDVFITNDTGPLRVADAFDKKLIALFGPTSGDVYGLLGKNGTLLTSEIECRPCYKSFRLPKCPYNIECLRKITVTEVFDTTNRLLAQN